GATDRGWRAPNGSENLQKHANRRPARAVRESERMDSIASEKPRIVTTGWVIPAVQLSTTLLILALNTTNALTLLAFVAVWGLTFRHWSLQESVCFLAVCALFSVMDILAVRQRLFTFSRADIGGLPLWEYFMWGFYVLHMLRALGGLAPLPGRRLAVVLAFRFA